MWRSVCLQLQHYSLLSKLAAYEKMLSSGKGGKPWMFNVTDIPWSSIQALTTDIRLPKRLCVFVAACLPGNIAAGSLCDYLTAQLMTWLPAWLHSQHQGWASMIIWVWGHSPDYLRITQPVKKKEACCCPASLCPSAFLLPLGLPLFKITWADHNQLRMEVFCVLFRTYPRSTGIFLNH